MYFCLLLSCKGKKRRQLYSSKATRGNPSFLFPVNLVSPVGPKCLVLKCKSRGILRHPADDPPSTDSETSQPLTLTADCSLPTAVICTLPRWRMAARVLKTSIWKSSLKPENKNFSKLGIQHFFSCLITRKIKHVFL